MTQATVKLLLADVDGTLVNQNKELTPAAIEAVHKLDQAGPVAARRAAWRC